MLHDFELILDDQDEYKRPTRAEAENDALLNHLYPAPPSGVDIGTDPWVTEIPTKS